MATEPKKNEAASVPAVVPTLSTNDDGVAAGNAEYEARKLRAETVEKAKWDAIAKGEDGEAAKAKALAETETRSKGAAPENR